MKLSKRQIIAGVSLLLFIFILLNIKLIGYGIEQARGQFRVLWNARPINEVLQDPDFPDSLKSTLNLVEEIKQFSIDSLGLKPTKNYRKVFDQQGEEILWVITACQPYKFEPLMWSFPIIGSFTYKGFFNKEKAIVLAREMNGEGYDVNVRPVSGWSTLGWFSDPILSNMLADGPGELANTLIHELTHSTLFIPDSMTFNENLATFIGNKGALEYLEYKYGSGSKEYNTYQQRRINSKLFNEHIVRAAGGLDSLYASLENRSDSIKQQMKENYINRIVSKVDTIEFVGINNYSSFYKRFKPNNAFFISFLNYRERQSEFETLLIDEMNDELGRFIEYWKKLYGKEDN